MDVVHGLGSLLPLPQPLPHHCFSTRSRFHKDIFPWMSAASLLFSVILFFSLSCEYLSRDERHSCSPAAWCGTSEMQTSLQIPTWCTWHAKQQKQWGFQRNHGRDLICAACRGGVCSPRYHLTQYRPAVGTSTFLGIPVLYSPHHLSFISWTIPWTGLLSDIEWWSHWRLYHSMPAKGSAIFSRKLCLVLGKHTYSKSWHSSHKIFSIYVWKCRSLELSDHRRLCFLAMFIIFLWAQEEGRKDDLCALGFWAGLTLQMQSKPCTV